MTDVCGKKIKLCSTRVLIQADGRGELQSREGGREGGKGHWSVQNGGESANCVRRVAYL